MGRVSEDTGRRLTWAVCEGDLTPVAAVQVCTAFLDVMADPAPWAFIDAWSDDRDDLPPEVENAQTALRRLQLDRDGRGTGMGIDIDRTDPAQDALLRTYAAWSIHVELLPPADGVDLVAFHDGASSITADLTDAEVGTLRERLDGVATLEPLAHLQAVARARRDGERRRRRAQLVRTWLPWWR